MSRLLIVVGVAPDDARAEEAMEATAVAAVFNHEVTLLLTGPAATWQAPADGALWPGALSDYGVTVLAACDHGSLPGWAQAAPRDVADLAAGTDRVLSF